VTSRCDEQARTDRKGQSVTAVLVIHYRVMQCDLFYPLFSSGILKHLKNVFVQDIENAVELCYEVMKGLNILCRYKRVLL